MARALLRAPQAALLPLALLACIAAAHAQAIQDSRCYLMSGGAVESFFISEDTPPGTVIGTLSVNGDPGPDGDITLTVQERGAGVALAANTKNLTLARSLDREERKGPSNVYVNVRCDRRGTSDPSFVIPVSVRVWDVNDNAPEWVGAPYRARLSEGAAVGTRLPGPMRASDRDQPGPHSTLHYSVLKGPHSHYFSFPNALESTLVISSPLDYEIAPNVTVTLRAQDQGNPPMHADAVLTVEVLDADDQNPKFTHDHYTALLPDDSKEGTILLPSPGPIAAYDQDLGIRAPIAYSVQGGAGQMVTVDRDSGRVAATRQLIEGALPATVVIKAVQVDNPDRYALATLSISRPHAPEALAFTQSAYSAAVREDAPPGTIVTTLHTTGHGPRDASPLQFYVSDRSFLDHFAINSLGEVVVRRPVDYEERSHYGYQVMVTDGAKNDTASLNISVINVNEWEPRFRYPQYEFRVEEAGDSDGDGGRASGAGGDSGLLPVGRLEVHDGDGQEAVALGLRGNDAGMFYLNSLGELFLRREALNSLNSSTLHVVATATDSGMPPKQTSVPVLVQVSSGLRAGGSRLTGVAMALAAGGALLAGLLLGLLVLLLRRRRAKASPSASPSSKTSTFVSHEKPLTPTNGGGLPPPSVGALGAAPSGSLLSVSAGASTILANSNSSLDLRGDTLPHNGSRSATTRQSTRYPKSRVAPAPPQGSQTGAALIPDHLQAPGRSGVAWPSQTIPARVKKLSWDDAADAAKDKYQQFHSHPMSLPVDVPSAPRLSLEGREVSEGQEVKEAPPPYASIDARRLRARYMRPIFRARPDQFQQSSSKKDNPKKLQKASSAVKRSVAVGSNGVKGYGDCRL